MTVDEMLKAADRALATNNLDAAESIVDSLLLKVKQAADDYEDVSNPSAEDEELEDPEDDSDDSEDDDDEELEKAAHEHAGGDSEHRMRGQHTRMNRPDTYRISAAPQPQGRAKRHRFESRVEYIRDRDGVSKTEAMSRARVEHPVLYTEYQGWLADRSTSQQHMTRGWQRIGKRGGSFEEMVSDQMIRKGVTAEVGAQRIANLYGYAATRDDNRLFKSSGESIVKRFQAEVAKIMDEDGCDATEATRLARIENPVLYKALCVI
jgi:hypothetical protein